MKRVLFVVAGVLTVAAAPAGWSQGAHEDGAPVIGGAPAAETTLAQAPAAGAAIPTDIMDLGRARYNANCAECHGPELAGGAGPALAGNARVADNAVVVPQVILGGSYMPSFGNLNNRTIAAILTYVRNSNGNNLGVVTADEVAAFR